MLSLSVFSHLRECSVLCSLQYKMRSYLSYGGFKKEIKTHLRECSVLCSLQYKMRSYLSYGGFKKEIKTHLVFDCLSKFTFGQGFTQLINESYITLV